MICVSVASDVCVNFHGCSTGQFVSENVDFSEVLGEICVCQSKELEEQQSTVLSRENVHQNP